MAPPSKPFTFTNGPANLIDADQVNADLDALFNALDPAFGGIDASMCKASFAKDTVEGAFSAWKSHLRLRSAVVSGFTAGDKVLVGPASGVSGGWISPSSAGSSLGAFYVNPADFAAGSRTVKFRLRATAAGNGTAAGITFRVSIYAVANYQGGSGDSHVVLGSEMAAIAALAGPGVNSLSTHSDSTPFLLTAADYVIVVNPSGTPAAGFAGVLRAYLDYQQV